MFGWLRHIARGPAPNAAPAAPQELEVAKTFAPPPPVPGERARSASSARASVPETAPAASVARPSAPANLPPCRIVIALGRSQYGYAQASPKTCRREDARWVPPGESVTLAGFEIPDGMIYVGAFMTAAPGGGWAANQPAPCLINPSLTVAPGRAKPGPDTTYWPSSYANLTPKQRLGYLTWLSTGKCDASFPVSYAFLYFYGLERRLLAGNPKPDEEAALVAEIKRLRNVHPDNHFLNSYSQKLLDVVDLRRSFGDPAAAAAWTPDLESIKRGEPMSLTLQIKLALHAAAGVPLGWKLATAAMLALSPYQGGPPSNMSMSRTRTEFIELVRRRFPSRFPKGFLLRNRKDSTLFPFYQNASPSFDISIEVEGYDHLPDPAQLTWTRLAAFCGKIAEDLLPYAKLVGRDRSRAGSLAAAVALPPDLADLGATAPFRRWLEALPAPVSEVPLAILGCWCLGDGVEASGPKQAREMSTILASVGFGMEPDPAHGGGKPGTEVLLFRLGSAAKAAPGPAFNRAAIAAAVLGSGEPAPDSVRFVSELVSRLRLSEPEALRLAARCRTMRGQTLPPGRIKRLVDRLPENDRQAAAADAAAAAAACGEVGRATLIALERLYDACGIDRRRLYAVLHEGAAAAASHAAEPVVVERSSAKGGARIPQAPEALKPTRRASDGLGIDMERVKTIMRETHEVAEVLAPIYEDDDEAQREPAQAAAPGLADGAAARWPGLNPGHARLLEAVRARQAWSRSDFEAMAREYSLMPDGAIETINEWAYDTLDDSLIEDGDPLTINVALLPGAPEGTP